MRILFDGYWWYRGPGANRSVQRDLITTWLELYPDDEVTVAVRQQGGGEPPRAATVTTRGWPHALSNLVELPRLAARVGADVMFCHNYTPLWGTSMTLIHDVLFVDHPEWFSRKERLYFAPMLASARRAAAVCASTGVEAGRIARCAPALGEIPVIGLAVPQELSKATAIAPEDAPAPGAFAVCVGRLNVRKNLAAVIRGAVASTAISPTQPLLIIGSAEYSGVDAEIPDEFASAVASGSIRFLGRISDEELAWLYRHAALAICLSLGEGFGLPAIEAVRFGTPALVSDIPVFHETVGGYAHFVDPLAAPDVVGQAIDDAWARPVDTESMAAISDRYAWPTVTARLRAAISGVLDR